MYGVGREVKRGDPGRAPSTTNMRDAIRDARRLNTPPGEVEGADGAQVLRTFGTGAQILRDLGVTRMRVLSAPKQMHGISGFGLEVVEYVDDPHPNQQVANEKH